MTTHTLHSDVQTHGLADECPRCQEIARDPLHRADSQVVARLLANELHTALDRRARDVMVKPPTSGIVPSPAEWERMVAAHPRCDECGRQPWNGHWPWCSRAPRTVRERYAEREQREHYRRGAREEGCTCPDTLDAHTHRPGCPLYSPAGGPIPQAPNGEGAGTPTTGEGPGKSREASRLTHDPSPAGDLRDLDRVEYLEHLEAEHLEDRDGRP